MKKQRQTIIGWHAALAGLVCLALHAAAAAQTEVGLAYWKGKAPAAPDAIAALGADMFGDKVNLYNGAFSFEQVDVELPGNNLLRVALDRQHTPGRQWVIRGAMADWDIHTPRVTGYFPAQEGWVPLYGSPANRCSAFNMPPFLTRGGFESETGLFFAEDYSPDEYWHGTQLVVPGHGSQEILVRTANLPTPSGVWNLVTRNLWVLGCLPALQNGSGQGFIARSPEGVTYRFDWMAMRDVPSLRKGDTVLALREMALMATQVTDRFGNSVTYSYNPGNPWLLERIQSSDGRVITLEYVAGRVSAVSDGTRRWLYQYDANGDLQYVVLPDASRWAFSLRSLVTPSGSTIEDGGSSDCDSHAPVLGGARSGFMVHPSGATGTFHQNFLRLGRTNVQRVCTYYQGERGNYTNGAVHARETVNEALERKVITGPGMPTLEWRYLNEGSAWGEWAPCTVCADRRTVTVIEPNGDRTRHSFGTRWRENEGQLLRIEEADAGGNVLRAKDIRYRTAAGQGFPDGFGDSVRFTTDLVSTRNRPEDLRTVSQQGVSFVWEADAGAQAFDSYARPVRSRSWSTLGWSRSLLREYHDEPSLWVMGQPKRVTETSTGVELERTEYHPAPTVRPSSQYSFGRLIRRLNYHADGTLRQLIDPAGKTTGFQNYRRGQPQRADFADGNFATQEINNLGHVVWFTNEEAITTRYGFDAMGRVASVNHPSGNPTLQAFEQVWSTEFDLPPGHWRQTVGTGAGITRRYFDGQWRVRLLQRYDANDPAATMSVVETRYDAKGRKAFESYPQRSLSQLNQVLPGTWFEYDALDRITAQRADSEQGVLTTDTQYISPFQKRVTNPRGYATTYAFQAFDTPSEDHVTNVWTPDAGGVTIARDVFSKANSISRGGTYAGVAQQATRHYVYDGYHRLCKTIEPETGATVQHHDLAGNLDWRASGQNLPSLGSCDQDSVPPGSKVSWGYDARDRLTTTTFGDGQPGISRGYTRDGLLQQLASSSFTWTYSYDANRLLTREAFSVPGQTPGSGWNFTYVRDANGHVAGQADPWGIINYSPNALGLPTEVSGYASGVKYHPNGMVSDYTLANGIVHRVTQNARGLPRTWQDVGVTSDVYDYDANGNTVAIADQQTGLNRSMGYDSLDRLTAANGVWGGGTYSYDALDNLRSSQVGGRGLVHSVDAATNRLTALSGSQQLGFGYDPNGNITQRGSQIFNFDIANRLRVAQGKAIYDYDGHGRRSWVVYANGSTQLNAYTGLGAAGRLMFSNQSSKGGTRYVYLGGQLIAEHNNQTGVIYSHTDALGSVVARTNAAGQVLGTRTRYEPYGGTAQGDVPQSIGFTGHVNDADTGLVYMQQRYYDPIAGRFLSVDPVTTDANTGSLFNRYNYAYNNPYRFKDPDGRFGVAGFLAGAAFEALAQWSVTGSVSDWKAVGVAGAVGTVTGGVGGYAAKAALTGATTAGKAIAATGLAGGAAAAGGKHAEAALKGETASAAEAGVAAAGGTLGAGAGAKIANSAAATLGKMAASKDGVVSGMAAATRGAIAGGGPAAVSSTVGSEAAQKSIDAGVAVGQKMVEEKMK